MKKISYFIIIFWMVILSVVLIYNETILKMGQSVLLKIYPIDPRDFLRGDYVALRYEINNVPENSYFSRRYNHRDVYVTLEKDVDGIFHIKNIISALPKKELYIKGEMKGKRISYPSIEKYFTKEGEARDLERKLQNGAVAKVRINKRGDSRIEEILFKE